MLFLTASKENGREGRPFCTATADGGRTWQFVSWIIANPSGYAIMPSTERVNEREEVTAIAAATTQRHGSKPIVRSITANTGNSTQCPRPISARAIRRA
jgi:hypothetical protein